MTKFSLKDLAGQLVEGLPEHFSTLKKDLEKQFHHILMQSFNKLDLITREEFDAQTKVLARTRSKLEALEKHLKELEKKFPKSR